MAAIVSLRLPWMEAQRRRAAAITLEAEALAADADAIADPATLRIEKPVRRYKRRLKGRLSSRRDSLDTTAAAT